jgi:long-chain acyl-CoA synthetase
MRCISPGVPGLIHGRTPLSSRANGSSAPGIKGKLFRWAFAQFNEYVEARKRGQPYNSLGWFLAQRLVFSKVKAGISEKLGGNMRLFVSGGAPLSDTIAYFFDLLGFQVLEGYGLTETSGGTFVNRPGRIKIGTVGPAFPGTQVRIAPDGEILGPLGELRQRSVQPPGGPEHRVFVFHRSACSR